MIFNRERKGGANLERGMIPSEELGNLLFGQLHAEHQSFFDGLYRQHNRIALRDLPHYIFWRDHEYQRPEHSLYYKYLQESWKFYFTNRPRRRLALRRRRRLNTDAARLQKIEAYKALKEDIERNGIREPLELLVTPDDRKVLLHGNHRAGIAYALGLDVPCVYRDLPTALLRIVHNENEFYGTQRLGKPYQSIYYGSRQLVAGRREDVYERFLKMDITNDIRGRTVVDVGSNIAVSAMLAWHFGAKSVTAWEISPRIASSALRLSTILDAKITVNVQDVGERMPRPEQYDTAFCFSLYAHVKDKKGLEANLTNLAGKTLYFEGHAHTSEEDYRHILKHFDEVELLGFNRDGVHTETSTRPFFRCTKAGSTSTPLAGGSEL